MFNYIQTINSSDVVSADTVNGETTSQKHVQATYEDVAGTVALGFASILAGLRIQASSLI